MTIFEGLNLMPGTILRKKYEEMRELDSIGKYRLNKDTLDIEFNDKFDGIAYGFPAFTNDEKGMKRLVDHLNKLYEERATLKQEVMEYRKLEQALKVIKESL